MNYPKWKLDKMGEYTGRLDNGVFAYLDAINRPEDTYEPPEDAREDIGYKKQLPDHNNSTSKEKECGVKLFSGLCNIMQNAEKGQAKKMISELHEKLRNEYPQFKNSLRF